MWNLNQSVFSTIDNNRGLLMSDKWPLTTPTNGLWSVATISSGHPSTKYFSFYNASVIARASPSVVAYLDSAGDVNLPLIKLIFHLSGQHSNSTPLHLHHFCQRVNKMPPFEQSVAMQVRRFTSKCCTPSLTAEMMFFFASLKHSCNNGDQTNAFPGFNKWRNGSIMDDMRNV